MPLESGLASQWCAVDETTYGVVPSLAGAQFTICDSDTLGLQKTPVESAGIYAGQLYAKAARRVITQYHASGALNLDVPAQYLNKWLFRMLGSYGQSAATLTQDATTGAYKAVHAQGALEGHTFTLQKGVATVDGGVVEPFTYTGCKVADWEISAATGQIAKLILTLEARNELAGAGNGDPLNGSVPALQPYTTPPGGVFHFRQAQLFYGGTPSTAALLAPPAAPTLTPATTGGTVAAGTYQGTYTYVDSQGETLASVSASVTTTTGTSTITGTSPAATVPAYATGWYLYLSQAGGTAASATRQQPAGSPTAIGTNYVLTAPPTSTGLTAPAANTTGSVTTLTSPVLAGNIESFSVKQVVPLDTARFAADKAGFRNEPVQNGVRALTGQFVVEWLSAESYYNAYAADTATAIQYIFTGPAIGTGSDFSTLAVLVPNIRLEGQSTPVAGPQVNKQTIPWTGLDDGVNNPIQATYWTLDSA